ncbi:hypothetical protein GCM10009640_09940 [Agrococcus citreus]|uniref:Uncharacterized protein n=1 Tax=Agrococcus citreus TaxID=84643 RepID=A0ABN1YQZ2_9MICO
MHFAVVGLVDVRRCFPDVAAGSAALVPHERTALLTAVVELVEKALLPHIGACLYRIWRWTERGNSDRLKDPHDYK